jgi:FkbM family methyltransferase
MQRGEFEPHETNLFRQLANSYDVLIDIGANIGYYTCIARHAGKQAVAVEPLEENLRWLYRNLASNGWNDTEVHPIGLSSAPGVAVLYGGGTAASLIQGWAGSPKFLKRSVPVNTLDNVVAGRFAENKLLIKVDVEGHEFDVLAGATQTLCRAALWIIEITLREHRATPNRYFFDTFEFFWRHDYRCFSADANLAEVTRSKVNSWAPGDSVNTLPTNWLFVPRGVNLNLSRS